MKTIHVLDPEITSLITYYYTYTDKNILWWSKYYRKIKVISALNNLIQARTLNKIVHSILVLNLSL